VRRCQVFESARVNIGGAAGGAGSWTAGVVTVAPLLELVVAAPDYFHPRRPPVRNAPLFKKPRQNHGSKDSGNVMDTRNYSVTRHG